MAEQRKNALGQTVEFNENTGRWDKVVDDKKSEDKPVEDKSEGVTTEESGTGDPAPGADETMVDEGAAPQRRVRFGRE